MDGQKELLKIAKNSNQPWSVAWVVSVAQFLDSWPAYDLAPSSHHTPFEQREEWRLDLPYPCTFVYSRPAAPRGPSHDPENKTMINGLCF